MRFHIAIALIGDRPIRLLRYDSPFRVEDCAAILSVSHV